MINFVLDKNLLIASGHDHLASSLASMGHRVHLEELQSNALGDFDFIDTNGECTVLYGSIQFVEQRMRRGSYSPGAYYSRDRFSCSYYMPRLPLELLGNGDGIYLPFSEFARKREQCYRMFGVSQLFIRPNSGAKVFTGLTLDADSDAFELSSLHQLTSVTDDTLILVAPAKNISAEYRFYIVEGKVITASRYMVEGKPSSSPEIDPECLAVAVQVAANPWQADLAYTCDVGLFDQPGGQEARVVEINAFSTSGLYECDSGALFQAVAAVARKEYDGEVSINS